jgi:hypothetical protein
VRYAAFVDDTLGTSLRIAHAPGRAQAGHLQAQPLVAQRKDLRVRLSRIVSGSTAQNASRAERPSQQSAFVGTEVARRPSRGWAMSPIGDDREPGGSAALVVIGLVILNAAAFLLELAQPSPFHAEGSPTLAYGHKEHDD